MEASSERSRSSQRSSSRIESVSEGSMMCPPPSSSTRRTIASRFSIALQVGQGSQSMRRVRLPRTRTVSGTLTALSRQRPRNCPGRPQIVPFRALLHRFLRHDVPVPLDSRNNRSVVHHTPRRSEEFPCEQACQTQSLLPASLLRHLGCDQPSGGLRTCPAPRAPLCLTGCRRDTTRRMSSWAASSGSPAR